MKVTICTIVLNEAEYIAHNLRQHYPLADRIVIVEGADRLYPKERVTKDGLSTDATADLVRSFPDPEGKIVFVQHGWCQRGGDQAKCELRNRYLEHALEGLLAVVDADEFYRCDDFKEMVARAVHWPKIQAWQYPFLHFWYTPERFITGGYYDVPHTRFWQYKPGDYYGDCHNLLQRGVGGPYLTQIRHKITRRSSIRLPGEKYRFVVPCCYHFGFCKSAQSIADKNRYYVNRGEGTTRKRTTASRAAWFKEDLPAGHTVWPYGGPLPEVFENAAVPT